MRIVEPVAAASPDARAERALTVEQLGADAVVALDAALVGGESVVVDGLLGTGSTGAPRGEIARAIVGCESARERGARVVAVDVPSGLDASTGATPGDVARADVTLTFGTIKRGQLVNREACGTIVVIDIGLGAANAGTRLPELVDEAWTAAQLPPIAWDAHKGTRKSSRSSAARAAWPARASSPHGRRCAAAWGW